MNLVDLLTIYQTFEKNDYGIFSMLQDYELDARLNREVLNIEIINQLGNMTPICNTTTTFKIMLDNFFLKWKDSIVKLTDSLYFEYNPIWNKDGTEVRTIEHTGNIKDATSNTSNNTSSTEGKVSAFNSTDYQPKDLNNFNGNQTDTGSANRDTTDTTVDSFIAQGNIGMTSTQQLINEERDIQEFNIYHWIVEKMKADLFLLVY